MTAAAGRRRRRQAPRVWWATAWMGAAHWPLIGPWATRLAAIGSPPYYGRVWLAGLRTRGYRSPSARIAHREFVAGRRCFIGDRVLIFQDEAGGLGAGVRLGDRVHIHQDVVLQCGRGARIDIGTDVHIQPRCLLAAYDQGHLVIGERVEIAANCGFFTYNHQLVPGIPIQRQPTATKGGIVVEDDAWIGFGAVVLDGVRIGRGAVVGAGAVVARDIPSNAIAAGVPARVIGSRLPLAGAESARVGERH